MSHNEKRGHWTKEGLISSATGMLFGASYVAMSHVSHLYCLGYHRQEKKISNFASLFLFVSLFVATNRNFHTLVFYSC